ncbi:MAG: ferredoxin [Deltaproteobacteria bacterium]|nr:ferredoxin [Deltaproteobacteria bacterium]
MVDRIPQNVQGRFYVDSNCINCALCTEIAPDNFSTNYEKGYEYVYKQPDNSQEEERIAEAMILCPADAIKG